MTPAVIFGGASYYPRGKEMVLYEVEGKYLVTQADILAHVHKWFQMPEPVHVKLVDCTDSTRWLLSMLVSKNVILERGDKA
jgi:hypothetical protein